MSGLGRGWSRMSEVGPDRSTLAEIGRDSPRMSEIGRDWSQLSEIRREREVGEGAAVLFLVLDVVDVWRSAQRGQELACAPASPSPRLRPAPLPKRRRVRRARRCRLRRRLPRCPPSSPRVCRRRSRPSSPLRLRSRPPSLLRLRQSVERRRRGTRPVGWATPRRGVGRAPSMTSHASMNEVAPPPSGRTLTVNQRAAGSLHTPKGLAPSMKQPRAVCGSLAIGCL